MKICLAQISSKPGDIVYNIEKHLCVIDQAIFYGIDCIFFPELSLTGYEPILAERLAITHSDPRLDIFQKLSDRKKVTIGVGVPTKTSTGIQISMLIFQPSWAIQIYSKTILHEDEFPYFEPGGTQMILDVGGIKISPAICYEALQVKHLEIVLAEKCELYLASVSKPYKNMEFAKRYFSQAAKAFGLPIFIVNAVGPCDNFIAAGQSSVYDRSGRCLKKLDEKREEMLIFDTVLEEATCCKFEKSDKW